MPIKKELRHFYRGPAWQATRARILARAGNRCEDCRVPNHTRVARACGWWMIPPELWWAIKWRPDGMAGVVWFDPTGKSRGEGDNFPREICRGVYIVIAVTHLNHISGDDRDDNLRARCQWCHLRAYENAHRHTRSVRKDAGRPLLREMSA
jgi:hypothetical protein